MLILLETILLLIFLNEKRPVDLTEEVFFFEVFFFILAFGDFDSADLTLGEFFLLDFTLDLLVLIFERSPETELPILEKGFFAVKVMHLLQITLGYYLQNILFVFPNAKHTCIRCYYTTQLFLKQQLFVSYNNINN